MNAHAGEKMHDRFIARLKQVSCALALLLAAACATNPANNFDGIHQGMTKAQVIAQIGGPDKSVRRGGADHWTYVLRNESGADEIREIEFQSGRATYVGDFRRPQISADEQDKLNGAATDADHARDEEDRKARNKMLGVSERKSPAEQLKSSDDLDLKLRDSMYGTESYKESGHAKSVVAPNYEEVTPTDEPAK